MFAKVVGTAKKLDKLFAMVVIVPTIISALYFGLIASDCYISESRFVVRSPQKQSMTGLGVLLQGAGLARSQDDSYAVKDYILSRDALAVVDKTLGIRKAVSSSEVDRLSRFGGVDGDFSFESFYKYYQKLVSVELDSSSSITTLKVKAFSSAEAYALNRELLLQAESLVNTLNRRWREDSLKNAEFEIAEAQKRARDAAKAVSAYRNAHKVFDPEKQSALQIQQAGKIQDELVATHTQLAQVRSISATNPQIPVLEARARSLQEALSQVMSSVAGQDGALSNKAADYERLDIERQFADKQLAAALAGYEQVRMEADRKQLYLERIANPNRPDKAEEPKRIRGVLLTAALGLLCWFMLGLLLAGVREHHD